MVGTVEAEVDVSDQLPQIDKIASEETFKAAIKGRNLAEEITRRNGWVNTGEGVNSITIKPRTPGSLDYKVGSEKIQMVIAEFGRRPGAPMPPEDPIIRWMNEVGIRPSEDQTWEGLAYVIRRSIAENGIEGFSPFRRAARRASDEFEDQVEVRLEEELEDFEV